MQIKSAKCILDVDMKWPHIMMVYGLQECLQTVQYMHLGHQLIIIKEVGNFMHMEMLLIRADFGFL